MQRHRGQEEWSRLGKSQGEKVISHAGCASVSFVEVSKHRHSAWHCQCGGGGGVAGHFHFLKSSAGASDVQPGVGLPRGAVRSDAGVTSNFGVEELRFISYVEGGSGGCNMWWFVFIKRKRHRERESLYGARKLYGWRRTRLGQPDTGRKPGSSTSYSGWVTYLLCTPVFSSVRWAISTCLLLLWGFEIINKLLVERCTGRTILQKASW